MIFLTQINQKYKLINNNMKKIIFFCLVQFLCFNFYGQENIKEVTLTVNGQGKTKDEAKFNALRNALENAFGAFISSNTSVINDELTKDEITSISSGNIKKIDILSEVQLPDGSYTTLINVTVSLSKLNDLCKNKGVISDFSGDLFAMNIKMQKFKKENELKIVNNLSRTINFISSSIFDFKMEVDKPKENPGTSFWNKGLWDIPVTIKATTNNNSKNIEVVFTKTIKEISLNTLEEKELIETNQKVFTIQINDKIYKLRNYESINLIHNIFFNIPFYALNFNFNNSLEIKRGSEIRNCVLERNRSLCNFTSIPDPQKGYKNFVELSYPILERNSSYSLASEMAKNRSNNSINYSEFDASVINFKEFSKTEVIFRFNNTVPLEKISKISQYTIEPLQ